MYKPHCSSWSVIDVFSVLSFQFDGVNWEIFAIASPIYLQYYSRAFFIITLPMYELQQLQSNSTATKWRCIIDISLSLGSDE